MTDSITYQYVVIINRSDVRFQLAPEEFSQVAVVLQVLNLRLVKLTAKQPDVQAQKGTPQEHWQFYIVEATPQSGHGF